MPSADFSNAIGPPCDGPSPPRADTPETSRGKFDRLRRTPAESTPAALDGYGLHGQAPARPTTNASIRFLSIRPRLSLPASFRPRLAATPLRFARTSPPSGCAGDFHPQVVEHARHTLLTTAPSGAKNPVATASDPVFRQPLTVAAPKETSDEWPALTAESYPASPCRWGTRSSTLTQPSQIATPNRVGGVENAVLTP
jgi:hypothetical protein